jgi:hypothetical protein
MGQLNLLHLNDNSQLILGFTGTRQGMSYGQLKTVQRLVKTLNPTEARHGNCVGSDADFHGIIRQTCKAIIVIHPPTNKHHCADLMGDFNLPEKPYMVRNDDIIAESHLMIATPFEYAERGKGSGTWAVIRHTRNAKKPLIIIWPDGTYTPEGDLQNLSKCARMLSELKKCC